MIREYYEQLYAKKLSNMEEMGKSLEIYKLPKVKQEELNRLITSKEIELVIKNLPKNESRAGWLSRGILSNIQRRVNTYSFEAVPKNCKWKENFQTISMKPALP